MCDYRVVEIERGVGGSFGFSVIGGIDTELPPMVCALVHNGSAQLSGKVNVGDVLVEVNGEYVSRLPAKTVVETLKYSPDTLQLRLRKDPEAAARARPFLRRYSVQDPKLQQFQTNTIRRSASLPSRARRPILRAKIHIKAKKIDESPSDMFGKGKIRTVGGETSPAGIDSGADGTFRRRMGSRSGSFSKITTSFPAHGGPPRTVENAERAKARCKVRVNNELTLRRATSEIIGANAKKSPLHSSSLPEITLSQGKGADSGKLDVWRRSASAGDGFTRRASLNTTADRITQGSNNNQSQKTGSSAASLSQGKLPQRSVTVMMNSSPYPFRENSLGSLANSTNTSNEQSKDSGVNVTPGGSDESERLSSDELARRLFLLEGYQAKDIAPTLYKNDDFSKKVAVQFMKYFDFQNDTLVEALRKLLSKFSLTGETQERERILIPFSNRYHECSKPEYGTADAVHTLVCAIMLLNTDLHGEQTLGKRMKQSEFIKNLSGLCDDKDYPTGLLKDVYASIKSKLLELHSEDTQLNNTEEIVKPNGKAANVEAVGSLALMGYQHADADVIYKEGLLYRKLIEEAGGKKASAWKRGWQPFCATLRGMILFLHKPDESRSFDDTRFSLGVHHSFASPAYDYRKRPAVFRLITADWKVLLFQARDKADMLGWVEGLNLVAASFSAPPLPAPVGSCKKFQKPVLPFSRTRLTLTQQLASHETKADEMANVLIEHLQKQPLAADTRQREMDEWLEKRNFFDFEYKRYRSYNNILKSSKLQAQVRERSTRSPANEHGKRNGLLSDNMRRYSSLNDLLDAADGEQKPNPNFRESYFMAIYRG